MFDVMKLVDLETGISKHLVTVASTALTSFVKASIRTSENEGDSTRSTRSMRMVE